MLSEKSRFDKYLQCQHNTRVQTTQNHVDVLKQNPSKRFKNTHCPFKLSARIEKRSTLYPCKIKIEWTHNHPVKSLQALSFKDVSEEAKNIIYGYFENGMTPGSAHKEYVRCLRAFYHQEILEFHKNI